MGGPDLANELDFSVTIRVGPAAGEPSALHVLMRPDQANTAPSKSAWTSLFNLVRQTFTPSLPRLTGVEVELVVANPGPASADVTLMVMNTEGIALAVVSKTVPVADCRHVLFVFPRGGLPVSPGAGLQHRAKRCWQPLRMEVRRGRLCEWGCVIQWQTFFTRCPQHFPVPHVRCEFRQQSRPGALPRAMVSLFFAVLAFCFITATAPFMLACRQKYTMNRRLCAAGSAF